MGENLHSKSDLEVENENVVVDSVLMHKATPDYLQELLKDKRQLQNFPNIFLHLEFILEKVIRLYLVLGGAEVMSDLTDLQYRL